MNRHTIIYKTGQLILPEIIDLHFVTDLLHVGQLELNYVGKAITGQNDQPEEVSLLLFHFQTEEKLDYGIAESELNHLLSQELKNGNPKISTEGNDIIVQL